MYVQERKGERESCSSSSSSSSSSCLCFWRSRPSPPPTSVTGQPPLITPSRSSFHDSSSAGEPRRPTTPPSPFSHLRSPSLDRPNQQPPGGRTRGGWKRQSQREGCKFCASAVTEDLRFSTGQKEEGMTRTNGGPSHHLQGAWNRKGEGTHEFLSPPPPPPCWRTAAVSSSCMHAREGGKPFHPFILFRTRAGMRRSLEDRKRKKGGGSQSGEKRFFLFLRPIPPSFLPRRRRRTLLKLFQSYLL